MVAPASSSALVVLFYIDWQFTLVALVLFPLCIVPVSIVGRKVRKAGGREEEEAGMLMVVMQESLDGMSVVYCKCVDGKLVV